MNFLKTTFATIVTLMMLSVSQAQVTFQRTYGGLGEDVAHSVDLCFDQGYIVAGYTTSYGQGGRDVLVLKLDSIGDVQWTKTYGGSNDDEARVVKQTLDGGYIIGGNTNSYSAGSEAVYLIKTDSSGSISWTKIIEGTTSINCNDIFIAQNGDILLLNMISAALNIMRIDENGTEVWSKTIPQTSTMYSIMEASNGDIFIGGSTLSFGAETGLILCLDANANFKWANNFHQGRVRSIHEKDTSTIVTVFQSSLDISTVSINSTNGQIISFTKSGSNSDELVLDAAFNGEGIVSTGYTKGFGQSQSCSFLLKSDATGNSEIVKLFSMGKPNYFFSIINDGKAHIACGFRVDNGNADFYVIKVDSLASSGCIDSTVTMSDSTLNVVENFPTLSIMDSTYAIVSGGISEDQTLTLDSIFCMEVKGCTNASAINYNPVATTDDGSCLLLGSANNEGADISIYPNPTTNILTIDLGKTISIKRIDIVNAEGTLIDSIHTSISSSKLFLDVQKYDAGKKLLLLHTNDNQVITKSFVK